MRKYESLFSRKMSMRIKTIFLSIIFFVSLSASAQQSDLKHIADWHGYTQFRYTTDFNNENAFTMQRLKFWIQSAPDFNKHWGFKVQTTLSGSKDEQFFLQDVMVFYRVNQFKLNLGQFVPEYSLERFQPDYEIPLTDRAPVVNALVPDGTLGVRDLGFQFGWHSPNHKIQSWLGFFNGYGIKEYRLNNSGFLITHKTQFNPSKNLSIGYSVMFRKSDQLELKNILPDSLIFSGNEFRYNLFAEYNTKAFHMQAEYLSAFLNHSRADGYYVLAAYNFHKNQFVASCNQYNDLINSTKNDPIVHIGYNYLFDQNKVKLMADNSFQIIDHHLANDILILQFQLFFK
ncbi:MAG: hypothetical protein IH595_06035 [Bacteroidales bacterium]|nr:hypothetical protein [Bacteroidales bacterium]